MTSNLTYQKDYTVFQDSYQLVLPLNLNGLVPEDDSVRLLSLFLALGYNINKLHAKIQTGRLGHQLHPVKEAA